MKKRVSDKKILKSQQLSKNEQRKELNRKCTEEANKALKEKSLTPKRKKSKTPPKPITPVSEKVKKPVVD